MTTSIVKPENQTVAVNIVVIDREPKGSGKLVTVGFRVRCLLGFPSSLVELASSIGKRKPRMGVAVTVPMFELYFCQWAHVIRHAARIRSFASNSRKRRKQTIVAVKRGRHSVAF